MAYENLKERRAEVARLLAEAVRFDSVVKRMLAEMFSCSPSAIQADVIALTAKPPPRTSLYVSAGLRKRVIARDNGVCQYCGKQWPVDLVLEHVLPASAGGPAREYNIVVACQSCNMRKIHAPTLPKNFDEITRSHVEWRSRVIEWNRSRVPRASTI